MKRARGAATVELVLTLIVLLPMLLYALFLSDLLAYSLEWEEAVVTPAWDAAPIDYPAMADPLEAAAQVQRNNRLIFCDHTSAFDSFDRNDDCSDEHHEALAAHQCWAAGGKQVTCGVSPDVGAVEGSYQRRFNRGGLLSCTARLGVQNYFLVQRVLNWGADLTRAQKYSGGVHANASSATTSNSWVFGAQGSGAMGDGDREGEPGTVELEHDELPPGSTPSDEHFALLHDPWALNHIVTILPDTQLAQPQHPFFVRLDHYARLAPDAYPSAVVKPRRAIDRADAFARRLQQAGILGATANTTQDATGLGDDPQVPNLAFNQYWSKPLEQGGGDRTVSMTACGSYACKYLKPPPLPPVVIEGPPVVNPGGPGSQTGQPGTPGPTTSVSVGGTNHSTSGNTGAQQTSTSTVPPSPPPNTSVSPPGNMD